MTALIIIGIILFIIFASSSKHKPTQQKTNYTNSNRIPKSEKQKIEELYPNRTKNTKIIKTTSSSSKIYYNDSTINVNNQPNAHNKTIPIEVTSNSTGNAIDDSIIDVTDQSYRINPNIEAKAVNKGVPKWAHHYVYSHTEINSASNEQKMFYSVFKNNFLSGEYVDLEGNTNYAFILLFDLLNEYESHKNISKLEMQLKALGQFYSQTKSYGTSFLIQKMTAIGDNQGALRLREEQRNSYQDYNYWGVGNKYKVKLNLNEDNVKLLNKLWNTSNNFTRIEFCFVEILKLYVDVIKKLKDSYTQKGTSIDATFLAVAEAVAKKHDKSSYRNDNYKYYLEALANDFYLHIYKHCENAVREHYGHKRKLNTDTNYTAAGANAEFESKIISEVTNLLPTLLLSVAQPDQATEIELFSQNTNRWKVKFGELTSSYKDNPMEFVDSIVFLGKLNNKNPSVENIFLEASKFVAQYDKESALSLYVHYLYHDLNSTTFDNKQLSKTLQKNLFKTNEQLQKFESIISQLKEDKDLEKALKCIPRIYEVTRKKIRLDSNSIKEVEQQHSGTVELLNEYLKDNEDTNATTEVVNDNAVLRKETTQDIDETHSLYTNDINFTEMQKAALELFAKNNLSVPQNELEAFAKKRGVFKNQLVDSINEICFDFVDDILIEQEDELYTINSNYHQRILAQ